jgi:hypothetical protein
MQMSGMIMRVKAGAALIIIMAFCMCPPLYAQPSLDDLVISPAKPSIFDPIRVDVPVRTCLLDEHAISMKATTTQVAEHVIALAVEQNGPSRCLAGGDGSKTKAFTFFIHPLAQGSYTVNFTRAIGTTVDLQRSSTFFVSAPLGGNSVPTPTQVSLLLLALLLLVAEALVIAARPNLTFEGVRRGLAGFAGTASCFLSTLFGTGVSTLTARPTGMATPPNAADNEILSSKSK